MFVKTSITLSILIPCYNWDICQLVYKIHDLCTNNLKLYKYEIICIEDESKKTFNNTNISTLSNTQYIILNENIGRSRIRNLMANKSKHKWLLFIDCDSKITDDFFINKYITYAIQHEEQQKMKINLDKSLYYGSTLYLEKKPDKNKILHWKYGKEIESKLKHINFSSHHFLIQKNMFNQHNTQFDESIKLYGYEDVFFVIKHRIKAIYINNPVYHIGIKNSSEFIHDTESALRNLILNKALENNLKNKIKIIKISKIVSKLFMNNTLIYLYLFFKKRIKINLLSESPSLFLFQFYKLGFFLHTKKHINSRKKS